MTQRTISVYTMNSQDRELFFFLHTCVYCFWSTGPGSVLRELWFGHFILCGWLVLYTLCPDIVSVLVDWTWNVKLLLYTLTECYMTRWSWWAGALKFWQTYLYTQTLWKGDGWKPKRKRRLCCLVALQKGAVGDSSNRNKKMMPLNLIGLPTAVFVVVVFV